MPSTPMVVNIPTKANVLIAPAMAADAGRVVAGELELNHECNLMHWSPEDFESKLQIMLVSSSILPKFSEQNPFTTHKVMKVQHYIKCQAL
ncbi:hypothetical protein Pint_28804 [Pistacia integerrima]|uniref:Uncharacterized protein n=1 Tax=Pistacia integerrima TaxID=434235 RepID=A0ACC0X4D1_9ROSI|nr:hypothetical protein Pint_28804 [Pistacia integerrima]